MKRLGVVVVLAIAGFAAALVAFTDPERQGCLLEAPRDATYSAKFEDNVLSSEREHVLVITRDGEPVTGAKVCVNIEMGGMTGMGYTDEAEELGGGRYRLPVRMPMAAPEWRATVVVEGEGNAVGIPMTFRVEMG